MAILCTFIQITSSCKTTKPKRTPPDTVTSQVDPFNWQKEIQLDVTQVSPSNSPISLQYLTQQYMNNIRLATSSLDIILEKLSQQSDNDDPSRTQATIKGLVNSKKC